jgi:hypothetical protein
MPGPALVIPPNYGQATFTFIVTGNTHAAMSSFGFGRASGYSMTTFKTVVETGWCGSGGPFAAAAMGNQFTLAKVDYLWNNAGALEASQTVFNRIGTNVQGPVPINCAEVINKVTILAGRANRGRMFIPPMHLAETAVDQNGDMGSVNAGVISGLFETARAYCETNSYFSNLLHHSAVVPTHITSLVCEQKLGTQRRRMRP